MEKMRYLKRIKQKEGRVVPGETVSFVNYVSFILFNYCLITTLILLGTTNDIAFKFIEHIIIYVFE